MRVKVLRSGADYCPMRSFPAIRRGEWNDRLVMEVVLLFSFFLEEVEL